MIILKMNDKKTLYIFLDEGGDLNFSLSGSSFFTMTALSIVRPFLAYEPLVNLKYDQWEKGFHFEYFHATEDKQQTRDEVFKVLEHHIDRFMIDSIIVEKRKTSLHLQHDHGYFYRRIFEILLRYVLERYEDQFCQIFLISDTIPIKRKRKEIEKSIKLTIAHFLRGKNIEYGIFHYASKSDINLQIVDYFNWAIFRKWARSDDRSYQIIKNAIYSEFDVFKFGEKFYY